jgi:hypothetical protein
LRILFRDHRRGKCLRQPNVGGQQTAATVRAAAKTGEVRKLFLEDSEEAEEEDDADR